MIPGPRDGWVGKWEGGMDGWMDFCVWAWNPGLVHAREVLLVLSNIPSALFFLK